MGQLQNHLATVWPLKLEHLVNVGIVPDAHESVTYFYLDILLVEGLDGITTAIETIQFEFEGYPTKIYGSVALAVGGPGMKFSISDLDSTEVKAKSIREFLVDSELVDNTAKISSTILSQVQPLKDRLAVRIQNLPNGTIEYRIVRAFYGDKANVNRIAYEPDMGNAPSYSFKEVVRL